MLREQINKLIKDAMLAKETNKLYVMKMIKAEFLKFQTSKGYKEEDFTDAKEISILQKMEKSWAEEIEMFKQASRDTDTLEERLNILRSYLPKEVSDEEIRQIIVSNNVEVSPKNMRQLMEIVRTKFPQASGKQISSVVKDLMAQEK